MTPARLGDLRSKSGIPIDELTSWLQKDIRRSAEPGDVHERGALFAATELDLSGFSAHCWRRLEVICSEDIARVVDDACAVLYVGERPVMEVPNYAVDAHTKRGRQLGRHGRTENEYESSYAIVNEGDVVNPYHDEARAREHAPARSSRRWLLGELHRHYERLDATHGDGRRWALELAGERFGRLVSSSRELSDDECSWLLERLRAKSTD